MSNRGNRPCPCGSGLPSAWQYDADGIELCRTCAQCHQKKMSRYRPDVQTVSSRHYGERVEENDPW